MVNYVERQYGGDPGRVFATGSSSGGMMTNEMLALYPDVFSAGAAFMGVPAARKLDAIAVCERATAEAEDPEDAGEIVRQWARSRKVGSYHPAITGAPPLTFGGRTGYELEGV